MEYLETFSFDRLGGLGQELSSSRGRTEHFKGSQAGCGSSFDAELVEYFEDMLFYRRFGIAENDCDLAVGFALGKPQQCFGDTRS
jgi:hypothetical protein